MTRDDDSNPVAADRAVILAAGRGSRMGSLGDAQPKCLVEFLGQPLIEWQIDALRAAGIPEIVLVTGYRAEGLASYGDAQRHNADWATTNMVHTLSMARDILVTPGATIVAYADLVYEPRVVTALGRARNDIATAIDLRWERLWRARFEDPLDDAETLKRDGNGMLLEIGRKPGSLDEVQGQFMGLTRMTQAGAEMFLKAFDSAVRGDTAPFGPRDAANAYFTDLLQRLIDNGVGVGGIETEGGWLEFDNADDVALYHRWAESGTLACQFDPAWRKAE